MSAASADPVAEKSEFLCTYMANHPTTLVAYVRYWGKVTEQVTSADMVSIDSKGMTLEYKARGTGVDVVKRIRVPFTPPLAGYTDAKPRLLAMAADAQEALGMTAPPQITAYHLPPRTLVATLMPVPPLYVTLAPRYGGALWAPGLRLHRGIGGDTTLRWLWTVFCVAHGVQALYVLRLCVRHRTGFIVGFQYVLSTLLFGGAATKDIRVRIQTARINSVMKGK